MSSILIEIKEKIALIRLNRPEKYNAFNREMALTLQLQLDNCGSNENVSVILITGNGKAFCAGQDLGELLGDGPPGFDVILSEHYNPLIQKIRSLNKPVVCAVNGVAAGAGANLAICGDVVVAAQSASFVQAFSKIGLVPDSGGTFTLPRLIGFQKASALMMLGDKLSAGEAERIGMVYKVFPDDIFMEESMSIARRLAMMPAKALAFTKQALNASLTNSLEEQLVLEDRLQTAAANTKDFKEGIAAFTEKRNPVFKGE